jgi:N-acetylglucosamine-6-phosphate deacetylase
MSSTTTQLALINGRIVLPDQVIESGQVIIDQGKIAAVSATARTPTSETIDLAGATVYPGFIDAHIHGSAGIDVMNASSEVLGQVSAFLVTQGVTSWLPTLVPAADDEYRSAVTAIDKASADAKDGARIVGLHYEGPFVNSAQCGALHGEHFKTYGAPRDLDQLSIPQNAPVRMITLAPEIEGGIELVSELLRRGWIVSIGHTRADESVLDQAFRAGARHMTHFMNAMPQLHHRQPGPVGWGLSRDDVTCDIIADGIHLHPLTLRMLMRAKGPGGLSLISDAIAAAGKGDGDYQIWGETITVKNSRTSNARGSIAGSVITMLDAVRMMRSIGATEVESARIASTNPARLLRLEHECGSIEEGKRADLVALDNDLNVKLTIVGGKIVYHPRNF